MEKRADREDEKDVCDIALNYSAHGSYPQDATKKKKTSVPFAKEQSSTECKVGSCIELFYI